MQKEISELHNLIKNKNIDKAYVGAKKIYQRDNKNTDIIKILAFLHIQKGQFDSAIKVLESYYDKNPKEKDFDYFINMGVSLKSNEEFQQSLLMYERAIEINPDSPLCYTTPAEIRLKLREFKKSIELINVALDKIKKSAPQNTLHFPNAVKLKTEINVALNNDNENGEMLKKILDEYFYPDIFFLLTTVDTKLVSKDLLKKAEESLKINDSKFENKLDRFWYVHPLYFGLAIYYQKTNQEKSEKYYNLGNNETMKSLRYNSFNYQKNIGDIIDNYKNNFVNESFESEEGANNIFILGTPRSGTTLIESMIASNDEVKSGGELLSANKLIQGFIDHKEQDVKKFVNYFHNKYLSRTKFIRGNYKCIVDKLPENFLFLGYITKLLPKTKIIRTFRNPWDIAISLYKQRYVTNIPYSASFFNIGVFMSNFEAINTFWNEEMKGSKNILDIHYEKLVDDPDLYQKKIYEFLELDSSYSEEKRRSFFSQTASIRQINSPVHKKSIAKNEFIEYKNEFYDAFTMQRKYWVKRGIIMENQDFFGYHIG